MKFKSLDKIYKRRLKSSWTNQDILIEWGLFFNIVSFAVHIFYSSNPICQKISSIADMTSHMNFSDYLFFSLKILILNYINSEKNLTSHFYELPDELLYKRI